MSWSAPSRLLPVLLLFPAIHGQTTAPIQVPTTPQPVTGTVLNAATAQPVYRALVRLNGGQAPRSALTDSEGHFTFGAVDPTQITLSAQKPGYSFSSSGDQSAIPVRPENFSDPVILRLYPEAILKGTVTTSAGEPLSNISIEAHRTLSDETGAHHTATTAVTRTNSHGQFRLPVPAGDYRIESAFTRLTSVSAVLPTTYPPPSDLAQTGTLHVRSGDQISVDLRPAVSPLIDTIIHVDQSGPHSLQDAEILPAAGQPFPIPYTVSGSPEQIHMSLPAGSYTLQVRHFLADGVDSARVDLSPTSTPPASVTLRFSPIANIPVETLIDSAAASTAASSGQILNPPNPNSLGLTLEPTAASATQNAGPIRLTQHFNDGSSSISFTAPAGTYRLRARPGNNWFVSAAFNGGTDLLSHDLLISSSAAATPIQITVSNQYATLKGNVTVDGKPSATWIYLFATTPTATPILLLHSSDDGTFTDTVVPPGTYRAIAFSHRHPLDPDNPESLAPYSTHLFSFTLHTGDTPSLTLEAVPDQDILP